jgi:hypothetical protein
MKAHKRAKEQTRRIVIVGDDEAGATSRAAFLHVR